MLLEIKSKRKLDCLIRCLQEHKEAIIEIQYLGGKMGLDNNIENTEYWKEEEIIRKELLNEIIKLSEGDNI